MFDVSDNHCATHNALTAFEDRLLTFRRHYEDAAKPCSLTGRITSELGRLRHGRLQAAEVAADCDRASRDLRKP